ncbi:MAG: ATP-dependent helicase [Planctomycetota bacterium]|jgi:DNA helicase-2/ATP-dependent DNA helicase PcrA
MDDAELELLLDALNPEQREAVGATDGPVLVLAGAGSGKTRVITVRTAYLLHQGVDPRSILLVTFTNKAADEMRSRLERMVGKHQAELLTIGTFHRFCLWLLRTHSELAGLGQRFSLCDAADQISGIKQVLRELHVSEKTMSPRQMQARVSLLKNRLVTPERAYAEAAGDEEDELVARGYEAYQNWLRRSRTLDFDDLLVRGVDLLREHEEVRDELRARFQYLMVDEYQDTNEVQYELLRLLAGRDGNLCAVGDDDQSIYGWRGADVRKILGFERDFEDATVVKLETNYRSTPQILEAANRVIRNNRDRHDKTLRAAIPDGPRVEGMALEDDTAEADTIALQIQRAVREKRSHHTDFAVLFRTATQPRAIETQLRARGIPYVLVGGQSFFDRKEIKDVIAYLRVASNPDDEAALLRILNRPTRGIGKKSIDRILDFATQEGVTAAEAFRRHEEVEGLPAAAARSGNALLDSLAEWADPEPTDDLVARIEELLERVGYRSEVEKCYDDELQQTQRWSAVEELLKTAERHVERRRAPTLTRFLGELQLDGVDNSRDRDEAQRRDAVTLMTLHAAKGLEFREVYLVGMEEGILPHARAVSEGSEEEERRLCYVGITRARERLVLSYCMRRARGGGQAESYPSRFLYEVKGDPPPAEWRAIDDPRLVEERARERARGARRFAGKRRR